ncbi:hypothetical protein PENSTE_c004G02834 [Penicillium steckii]|uniref:Methyltransferase type 11 domain-containing protein n=1 Tax=Penicillium steckii TaxID=303698 RepID=A0A1V6TM61_9EURO|nr:hypothetical protein PENSTE_c004G02834 [Penicillium steckii]
MAATTTTLSRGTKQYTPLLLSLYDAVVLGFSTSFIWRCPTRKFLLPMFTENFSARHLDVGVGTGYFPSETISRIAASQGVARANQHLSLVDLNPNALESAKRRVNSKHSNVDIRCILADAAKPLPTQLQGIPFDSASCSLLLHCMPGPTAAKSRAFKSIARVLSRDGVLVGSTVLGRAWEKVDGRYVVKPDIETGRLTSSILGLYNRKGIFDNCGDDPQVFEDALSEEFEQVEARIVGMVFLFKAKGPRRDRVAEK